MNTRRVFHSRSSSTSIHATDRWLLIATRETRDVTGDPPRWFSTPITLPIPPVRESGQVSVSSNTSMKRVKKYTLYYRSKMSMRTLESIRTTSIYVYIRIDTVENMHVLLFENYSKDKQGNMEGYTCIIVRKYSKNGYMHGEIFVYYRRKVFEGWVGTEKYTYCTKCVWKYIIRNIRKKGYRMYV